MRIIFYGTPDFAVPSLKAILNTGHEVLAVVTAPDRNAGRGLELKFSAVKKFALLYKLKILQPTNLKDPVFLSEIKSLEPELQLVVAFRMMPEELWKIPSLGTINLHASLLPQYRGAAPINWAIINGETETGLTTFFINQKIDTGDIIKQHKVSIGINLTAGELHDQLMYSGSDLIISTIEKINSGNVDARKQDNQKSKDLIEKSAPKIFSKDCSINWSQNAISIHNFIRGLSPYPGAYSFLFDDKLQPRKVKIYKSVLTEIQSDIKPGILKNENNTILVGCNDFMIQILELQIEGKRRMPANEFINGNKIDNNCYFGNIIKNNN